MNKKEKKNLMNVGETLGLIPCSPGGGLNKVEQNLSGQTHLCTLLLLITDIRIRQ